MSTAADRRVPADAEIFKARLIFAANSVVGFWVGILGYFLILGIFVWSYLRHDLPFQNEVIIPFVLVVGGIISLGALLPGRLFAMWPYAITVEPEKGFWVYAPPAKLWVPLEEIVDIDVYSGMYGGGNVIQLRRSHGLVKKIYLNSSLAFPDQRLASRTRALIDRCDGVQSHA